jgi:excinuclease UvrABC ATPase subunit
MNSKVIKIKGARENNLKDIDIVIPKNKIVLFIGVSGSGKTTIAFDIIAREGQRQYLESLSAYARRFLHRSNRPDIDEINGLSPTIMIKQEQLRDNPRSTVGTITEIYTYLRLLFSRVGLPSRESSYFSFNHPYGACPKCKGIGTQYNINVKKLIDFDKSLNQGAIKHSRFKPESRYFNIIKVSKRLNLDKPIKNYSKKELDFLLYSPKIILSSKEQGFVQTFSHEGVVNRLLKRASDLRGVSAIREKSDSKFLIQKPCSECKGGRLNKKSLAVKINKKNIGEVSNMSIFDLLKFVKGIKHENAKYITPKLIEQLQYLIDVGIGYLSLNRSVDSLSGGETQRTKLARQLTSELSDVIYILDEPTAGLHSKDIGLVLKNLNNLKNKNNTIIVVEHDLSVIKKSDYIIEIGPGGGQKGGQIIYSGIPEKIYSSKNSITAKYLSLKKGKLKKDIRKRNEFLKVRKAKRNNLKNINLDIPLNSFVSITGVSGSGKSSLVEEIIAQTDKNVYLVDQSAVGKTRRGNVATYIDVFKYIRQIFAKENYLYESLFSFNARGACPECKGLGYLEMDMNFLGNIRIKCEKCEGKRYNKKALKYKYNGKNIAEVLDMTVNQAYNFFTSNQKEETHDLHMIENKLEILKNIGLGYIELGQTLDTLSGGESQRLKLTSKLYDYERGDIYILDEPTAGLHSHNIKELLDVLNSLIDNGNSVIVIEHNLEVIRQSDWIIDLGPEGGEKGGRIVVQGTPEKIAQSKKSDTGRFLRN